MATGKVSSPTVLVAGAGPVGLTMAAALVEQGLDVRIVDKAPQASDKSKALVVWSRTLELLDKLGVAQRFNQTGLPAQGFNIYGGGKQLLHMTVDDSRSPFAHPLMIPQSETERLLGEHLASRGVNVEWGTELVSLAAQGDGVVATLRKDGKEETCRAGWLAGCDGAHSTVRHVLGVDFAGKAEPSQWILADLHLAGAIAPGQIYIYWHEKGVLALFPILHNRYRMIADLGSAGATTPEEPTLADVQAVLDERGPGNLQGSDAAWVAHFRISERKVAEYRHGRTLLAGDAAHIHSPAGGQGMNTGMQDAFNLAWKLALVERGQARADVLLDSYTKERSPIAEQVLKGAGIATEVATMRNPLGQFLRNHTASILFSFSLVRDKIRDVLGELSINYRHSSLAVEEWSAGTGGKKSHPQVQAGDRLPDAPLVDSATGASTTLFAATRHPQHALLLLPSSADAAAIEPLQALAQQAQNAFPDVLAPLVIVPQSSGPAAGATKLPTYVDSGGLVFAAQGAEGPAVVVVRPDGYLGYRGQPADAERLLHYLDTYLARR